jgi:hypothetical protein
MWSSGTLSPGTDLSSSAARFGDGTRHRGRLMVRTSTEQDVGDGLVSDPWARTRLLVIESIEKWEVLISTEPRHLS